jgi:PAT family beta-lactamase induction signal transducer AmpG
MTENEPATRAHAHPIVYMFLALPFGVSGGFVTVTLGYLFSKAGISVETIAGLSAATILPGVLKFLWAPLVDACMTLKKWYVLSCIVTAAGLLCMGILPIKESSITALIIIIYITNIASSFLGTATSGLAAHDIPEEMKGRLSGYYNAGNLGGSGIGGGMGLWLAENLSYNWMPAAILSALSVLCCFGLLFVREYASTIREMNVGRTMLNLFKDIWITLKARMGILAMVLCFLPLGTGAASGVWSAIAGGWNASAQTVEFVTGVMSGLITAAGCLLGGWICDRNDRKMSYVVFGLMLALCAVGMAYSPHTEWMYIIWTSLYAFVTGLCYAAFSAFVFEAIGKGAAGTKYTVFASLSNFPIWYMTIFDGWAYDHYKSIGKAPEGMLYIEAACGIVGIVLFLIFSRLLKGKKVSLAAN